MLRRKSDDAQGFVLHCSRQGAIARIAVPGESVSFAAVGACRSVSLALYVSGG